MIGIGGVPDNADERRIADAGAGYSKPMKPAKASVERKIPPFPARALPKDDE